jgi:hypothetical protein
MPPIMPWGSFALPTTTKMVLFIQCYHRHTVPYFMLWCFLMGCSICNLHIMCVYILTYFTSKLTRRCEISPFCLTEWIPGHRHCCPCHHHNHCQEPFCCYSLGYSSQLPKDPLLYHLLGNINPFCVTDMKYIWNIKLGDWHMTLHSKLEKLSSERVKYMLYFQDAIQ